jgi:hypothetical protein
MNRALVLASLLALFLLALPVFAQEATPTVEAGIPVACTQDEDNQIHDLLHQLDDKVSNASTVGADVSTPEKALAGLLAWGDVNQSFFSDVYPNMPTCVDGIFVQAVAGLLFEQQLALDSAVAYSVYATQAQQFDNDVHTALSATVQGVADQMQQNISSYTSIVPALAHGPVIPGYLPTCTADQLKFNDTLDGFEQRYADLAPNLQAYLDSGTVDNATYIAAAGLMTDLNAALKVGSTSCAELFTRILYDNYTFMDTFIALGLGAASPYIQDLSDTDSVDKFNALRDYFNSALMSYIEAAVGTPAATEASS